MIYMDVHHDDYTKYLLESINIIGITDVPKDNYPTSKTHNTFLPVFSGNPFELRSRIAPERNRLPSLSIDNLMLTGLRLIG